MGVEYSFIEYMRDFIYIYGSARCMAIIIYDFQDTYKKTHNTQNKRLSFDEAKIIFIVEINL